MFSPRPCTSRLTLLVAVLQHVSALRNAAEVSLAALQHQPDIPAFDVQITITNKEEVFEKKSAYFGRALAQVYPNVWLMDTVAQEMADQMPAQLAEKGMVAEVTKKNIAGLTATMTVKIVRYDVEQLLTSAKGEEFAKALISIQAALIDMGMSKKSQDIDAKITANIYAQLWKVLPQTLSEKLAENQIRAVIVLAGAPPEPESPPPQLQVKDSVKDLYFWIVINNRDTIRAAAGGIKGFVAAHEPSSVLARQVEAQLSEMIPQKIKEEVGDGLTLTIKSYDDFGEGVKTDPFSLWLNIHLDEFDAPKLLVKAKGEKFADAFTKLVASLEYLKSAGIAEIASAQQIIGNQVSDTVMETIYKKLTSALRDQLGAEIIAVKPDYYQLIKDFASKTPGRCCGLGAEHVYWVAATGKDKSTELLRGHGLLEQGMFGRSGHCPIVNADVGCAVNRRTTITEAFVATQYEPTPSCFLQFLVSGNLADFPTTIETAC